MSNPIDIDPLLALQVAADKHRTLTRVAELLSERGESITKQGLNGWERIPAERCLPLFQIIDGAVPLHRMRPDIYPDPAQWPAQVEHRCDENV